MVALRLRFHLFSGSSKVHLPVIRSIATATALTLLLLISGCGSSLFGSKDEDTPGGPENLKKLDPDAITHKPLKTKAKKPKAKLYKPATTVSLEIPPDLVNTTNQTVLDNLEAGKQNKIRVLPEVVGARIVKQDGQYGLEVDTDVESAWETVTRFWALSHVNLVEYNPEAGTMETDWIEKPRAEDPDASYLGSLSRDILTSLTKSNTKLDKYRIRFERISANQSYLNVAHRSSVRKEIKSESQRIISQFDWVELPSDPNSVADFLQHLILIFDDPESS